MVRKMKEGLITVLKVANRSKGRLRKAVVLKTDKVMNARLRIKANSTHLHLRRFNLRSNGFFYFQQEVKNTVHCKIRSGFKVLATPEKSGLRKAVVLKTDKVMNARLHQREYPTHLS